MAIIVRFYRILGCAREPDRGKYDAEENWRSGSETGGLGGVISCSGGGFWFFIALDLAEGLLAWELGAILYCTVIRQ
jgi:hypothetical protein